MGNFSCLDLWFCWVCKMHSCINFHGCGKENRVLNLGMLPYLVDFGNGYLILLRIGFCLGVLLTIILFAQRVGLRS